MKSVTIIAAFSGGLLSFFSPCLLPLLPAYLSFLSGVAVLDQSELKKARVRIFLSALFFVLGFTLIFSLFGVSAGALGRLFIPYKTLMVRISGIIVIIFGLYMVGAFRLLGLPYLKSLDLSRMRVSGYLGSLLVGAAFSFGYIPCIGPILGAILVLASTTGKAVIGGLLLAIYSVGFGLPFLIVALGISLFTPLLRRLNKIAGIVYIVAGVLLIIFGILVLTGLMTVITSRLGRLF